MPNEISTERSSFKCPSCNSDRMMRVQVLEHSDNKRLLTTDNRYRTLMPHNCDVAALRANRYENHYDQLTQEQLDAVPILKYVCQDCGIIVDRIDPQSFKAVWDDVVKYKYQPLKLYTKIVEEYDPDFDVVILHHQTDRSKLLEDFIEKLRAQGMSVSCDASSWENIDFIDTLGKQRTQHVSPLQVWSCRMCILIVGERLLKELGSSEKNYADCLKKGLCDYTGYDDPKSNQWILPVSLEIAFEDFEQRKILDDRYLFRNLKENGSANVAKEIAERIVSRCRYRA